MIQRRHAIEEVRRLARAVKNGGFGGFKRRPRMAQGDDDAALHEPFDQIARAVQLRRERNDGDMRVRLLDLVQNLQRGVTRRRI